MKKLLEFIKINKTVIIIIVLIFVLIVAVVIVNGSYSEDTSAAGGSVSVSQTDTEKKLSLILSSISGVGDTQVMINEDESGINGVIIVCSGANNIMTRNDILNAVSTALNIEKNIIAVYAMN